MVWNWNHDKLFILTVGIKFKICYIRIGLFTLSKNHNGILEVALIIVVVVVIITTTINDNKNILIGTQVVDDLSSIVSFTNDMPVQK